ncbi:hypothetical protein TIFTF001_025272 [Ficus carica]|uniref:Uncharacterized protein n=1 Tax=Ficus carica TaxID=3494 RepID=A0AA88DE11_FICCA|nr:hypothetical protein TIFTF001_025272 [Ficus carica]
MVSLKLSCESCITFQDCLEMALRILIPSIEAAALHTTCYFLSTSNIIAAFINKVAQAERLPLQFNSLSKWIIVEICHHRESSFWTLYLMLKKKSFEKVGLLVEACRKNAMFMVQTFNQILTMLIPFFILPALLSKLFSLNHKTYLYGYLELQIDLDSCDDPPCTGRHLT